MVRDNPPSHRSIRAKKEGALPGKRKNCPTLQPTEETEIDNNDVLKVLKTIRSNTTFIGVFALVIMITTIAQCAKGQELKFELSHSGFWTIRTGVDEFEDNDLRHMELSLTVRTGGRTEYDSYEMDNDKSLFVVCHNNELHLQLGIHRESPYNYMTRDVWGYSRKTPLTVLIKLDEERLPDHVIHRVEGDDYQPSGKYYSTWLDKTIAREHEHKELFQKMESGKYKRIQIRIEETGATMSAYFQGFADAIKPLRDWCRT